jgi:hypothetical protein
VALKTDISIENKMVPTETTVLTGGLTYKERKSTIVDWNLAFAADGVSSGRSFHNGTLAFMSPSLLEKTIVTRRHPGHDMESFFAVILRIATLDYDKVEAWKDKPREKATHDIAYTKTGWFGKRKVSGNG